MEMIPYSTASALAEAFRRETERMKQLLTEADECASRLNALFPTGGTHKTFSVSFEYYRSTELETIFKRMKLTAWATIIDHIGIKKMMSSKRRKELDDLLYRDSAFAADQFPDISEETIISVLMGYVSSSEEFLEEAIREEYDYWKPHRCYRDQYKTNKKSTDSGKLEKKFIQTYAVERGYQNNWRPTQYAEKHLIALDNIFHILDGKGPLQGYRGPLVDAIGSTVGTPGSGSTEYFSFRLFENKNIHLTFLRQDLLDKFNLICGRNRLAGCA